MLAKGTPGLGPLLKAVCVSVTCLMNPVPIQHRRHVIDPMASAQPQLEIIILGVDELRAITKFPQHFCLQAGGVHRNWPPGGLPQIRSGRSPHDVPQSSVHEFDEPAAAGRDIGSRFQKRDLTGQPIRQRHVVGIHAGNVLRRNQVDTGIERENNAGILFIAKHADPRVAKRPTDRLGAVRRAVVDNEQLKRFERLREDALDCLSQESLAVIDRQEHRHDRRLWVGCHTGVVRSTELVESSANRSRRAYTTHAEGRRTVAIPQAQREYTTGPERTPLLSLKTLQPTVFWASTRETSRHER